MKANARRTWGAGLAVMALTGIIFGVAAFISLLVAWPFLILADAMGISPGEQGLVGVLFVVVIAPYFVGRFGLKALRDSLREAPPEEIA